jgi:hypothetical protein
VQRATRAGYLIPMKTVARQKVLAGITSEMEVAAVLGLVESKRQYSNQSYRDQEGGRMQDPMSHGDGGVIEGEIVG